MLSLQKCRSLLGTDCKLTDAEIEKLREAMYALSDVAIEAFCAQKRDEGPKASPNERASCLTAIPESQREPVEERAAILEYDGNLTKPEAERQAFGEWVRSRKSRKKSKSKKQTR